MTDREEPATRAARYVATLDDATLPPMGRVQKLLLTMSADFIDDLPAGDRRRLCQGTASLLGHAPIPDAMVLYAARQFPELAIEMLERGANGQVVDTTRPHKPGVMQYLLDHCTELADAYGTGEAQQLLRGAFRHAYPCPNRTLLYDILVEAEGNGWVMALMADAAARGPTGAQEVLEACACHPTPAASIVQIALDNGADLFAEFQPLCVDTPRQRVIDYVQTHPTPWATAMFNGFAAHAQAGQMDETVARVASTPARPRL